MVKLAIVVPCYNEEAVVDETAKRLVAIVQALEVKQKIAPGSSVYFVDDGSRDRSWTLIEALTEKYPCVRGIKLSRNRGHQNALLAGVFTAEGDAVISVDADLQDDLGAIEEMIDAHAAGSEIVYGVRRSREVDSFGKRATAELYYRALGMMGVEIVFNHADYRLMGRSAIEALRAFDEVNLFLRGIIPQLGFRTAVVHYDRAERFAGESKYPVGRMLALAIQGVTSFSALPLRMITVLGLIVAGLSLAGTAWVLWIRLLTSSSVPGWASTLVPIYFLGGVQLLCIGIIGEYLAKIYMETKRRPRYIIEKTTGDRSWPVVSGDGRGSPIRFDQAAPAETPAGDRIGNTYRY